MSDRGLVTNGGRTLMARLLAGEDVGALAWFAIGRGDWADKQAPPSESVDATALADETARKRVERYAYLVPDVAGSIVYNGVTYAETQTPTPIVAFYATLTESEAVGHQICEEGLFGGTVVTTASPYALPGEVSSPGVLYWVKHRPSATKGAADSITLRAIFGR